MLRRDRQIRMQIHQLVDACIFALSFWLAYRMRADAVVLNLFRLDPVASFEQFAWVLVVLIPAAPLVLEAQGFYDRPILCSRAVTIWQLFKGCFVTTIGLILVLFLSRLAIARWVPFWFGATSFLLVFGKEEMLRIIYKSKLAQAQIRRRFVVVGTGDEASRARNEFQSKTYEGVEILAELDLTQTPIPKLAEFLHEHSVNGVILSAKHSYFEQVEAVIRACELEGIEVWLIADFFSTQISRTSFDDFLGRPVLVFSTTPEASWQSVSKQVVDLFGSFALLVICAIPLLFVALLIRLTSPGPVLFRQQRSGLNGRPFTILKFRTMVTDAEQRKHELASMNEMSGPVFKMTNDPRITPIGKILRKFSIDELPQLFNVLRGEMSLVGPRPLPVAEVKQFNDLAHRRRLSVKPGLTCLWQISGRNEVTDFKDWVRLDLEYIDNWSIWLDLKILWRTIPAVLLGSGAK
ncbi:MAG TPA: sugar transferase [Verrucomicrobiae bacterium]|nr:sugar transferase [Verrucomicrobiae bacterium]